MPKTVEDLSAAIEACAEGDTKCINNAKRDFSHAGGEAGQQEGGKVFTDPTGGKVFVTDGGKVFWIRCAAGRQRRRGSASQLPRTSRARPQRRNRTDTSTPNAAMTRIAAAATDASRSPPPNSE